MCFAILISFVIAGAHSAPQPKAMDSFSVCGVEASASLIHHNPWLVYLEYHRRDRILETRCAATLIDSRHLLTAAHCVNRPRYSKLVARLGEYDVTKDEDCIEGLCSDPLVRVKVEDVTIHPGYDGSDHDIAVLTLQEPVQFTDFIRPACLPTKSSILPEGTILSAAGWGEVPFLGHYSAVKKIVPLPLRSKDLCRKAYDSAIPEHIICAGGEEGIDTCRGDSGGPLTFIGDKVELVGVTSAGSNYCGTEGSPAMYTKVSDHLDWILSVTSG